MLKPHWGNAGHCRSSHPLPGKNRHFLETKVGRQWAPEGSLDVNALYADHKAWLSSRGAPHEAQLSMFEVSSMSQLSRLDLPSYVLFACLDAENKGYVSAEALRQLEDWPSPVAQFVAGAQLLYDPSGTGVVSYAHFRRFCSYLDHLRPDRRSLTELRLEMRQALADLCGTDFGCNEIGYPSHNGHNHGDGYNSSNGSNGAKISRGLDAPAELSGLVRLLQDTTSLRRELAEVLAGAFLAVRSQNVRSYRGFLIMGRHSQIPGSGLKPFYFWFCLKMFVSL